MKSNLLIVLVAISALVIGVAVQMYNVADQQSEQMPPKLEFSFPDMQEKMQPVTQWQGKILVINFWATWCPPCLKEIPEFIQWQQEFQPDSVQFVGIAIDDKDAVAGFLKSIGVNYPMLIAGDEGFMLARQLGNIVNVLPFTIIVDRQGKIVHRQSGELSRAQFLEAVRPLIRSYD